MNKLLTGMDYLLDGFRLIAKPGLRQFVIIPLILNISLFAASFFVLRYFMTQFNIWFAHYLPVWLQWFSAVLWFIFFISFFFIIIYLFVTIANLISAPFNSYLAEKVELYLTGNSVADRSLLDNIKDMPRILGRQFAILFYYLPRACLILLLFFIPIVQSIAPILSFAFHAWFLTMTYIDYPTDNHRIPISDVRVWMRAHRLPSLGFGVSVLLCSLLPVINCFTISAAVAGATKFWVKENHIR